MKNNDLVVTPWSDYEFIDSGNNRKLERFGKYILIRPETQALWAPLREGEWKRAQAEFVWQKEKGKWKAEGVPEEWEFSWGNAKGMLRLTNFKHVGVFPEQAENWQWLKDRVNDLKTARVLNLFAYTGFASIVAAQAGAQVTHVDASRQSNAWAKENAARSWVPAERIRYILDDAMKFVEREARRGAEYEGIILDPPAFGRGAKNEVWHIEHDLQKLLSALVNIFSNTPGSFFLLNGYAAGYAPQSLLQSVASFFPDTEGEFGELHLKESRSERRVPSGIYVRFVR